MGGRVGGVNEVDAEVQAEAETKAAVGAILRGHVGAMWAQEPPSHQVCVACCMRVRV